MSTYLCPWGGHTHTHWLRGQKQFQETRHLPAFGQCAPALKIWIGSIYKLHSVCQYFPFLYFHLFICKFSIPHHMLLSSWNFIIILQLYFALYSTSIIFLNRVSIWNNGYCVLILHNICVMISHVQVIYNFRTNRP